MTRYESDGQRVTRLERKGTAVVLTLADGSIRTISTLPLLKKPLIDFRPPPA